VVCEPITKSKPKTVAQYVNGLPKAQREIAKALRQLVLDAAPKRDTTEAIKWTQPVFSNQGPFAFMKAARNHVTLGFWRGVELDDPKGLLEGSGSKMRHVKIKAPEDIKKTALRAMVKQAVNLNQADGDPTRQK
jgi:hypothetical protein